MRYDCLLLLCRPEPTRVSVGAQLAPLALLESIDALITTRTLGPIAATRRLGVATRQLWVRVARAWDVDLGVAGVHRAELSRRAGHLIELVSVAVGILDSTAVLLARSNTSAIITIIVVLVCLQADDRMIETRVAVAN